MLIAGAILDAVEEERIAPASDATAGRTASEAGKASASPRRQQQQLSR